MKKIPKIFNKTYNGKKFRKKVLKRIYTSNDKSWIEDLFEEKDDLFKLKEKDFTKEEIKRLKELEKSIKKNKGLFNKKLFLPLIIILFAIIVFNILFLDSLLEKVIEVQLGNTLETKVYVEKLDLKFLKGQITIGALAIEEEGSENLNLLIENMEADIDTGELLKKKVFMEELSFKNLAFNVPAPYKMESAWKPQEKITPAAVDAEKKSEESFSVPIPEIPDLDPQSIWASEKENLILYKNSQGSREKYEALYEQRANEIEDGKKKTEAVIKEAETLMDKGFSDLKNPAEIQARVKELNTYKSEIALVSDEVKSTYEGVKNDVTDIKEEALSLKENFNADRQYLLSKTELPDGGLKGLASDLATSYIKKNFNSQYSKFIKFKGYFDKAMDIKKKTVKEKEKTGRRSGRTLDFNQKVSPSFVLQKASGSWQISENKSADMTMGNLTSDPENWKDNPYAAAVYASNKENWNLEALSPVGTDNWITSDVNGSGIPLVLTEYLSTLGLKAIESDMKIMTNPGLSKDNIISGDLAIILNNVTAARAADANLVQKEIADVLEESGEIIFDGTYEIHDSGKQDVKLGSNLDSLLQDAVKDIMAEKAAEAREALNEYLNDYLSEVLKENEEILGKFGIQESVLDKDLTSMDTYSNLLEDSKDSVSNALNAEADKLKAQALAEADKAKAAAQAEADKAEAAARAEADKKKAEAEAEAARLKAEAEKKKAEEEARLKKEAEEKAAKALKDKVKIPSW